MGMPSLIVIKFGETNVLFRKHNAGYPELLGSQLLDMLESAQAVKPRAYFHTGSYLLRALFAAGCGDERISPKQFDVLPLFEAISNDEFTEGGERIYGDWEFAYELKADSADNWTVSFVENCEGESWNELAAKAKTFSVEEFRKFVDDRFDEGHRQGKTY